MFNLINMFSKREEAIEFITQVETIDCLPLTTKVDKILYGHYIKAMNDFESAKNRFEHAAVGYEDVAILELAAAEARFNAIMKEVRAAAN